MTRSTEGLSVIYCPTGGEAEQIWRIEAHNYLQMMVFKDTGELIIEDAELPPISVVREQKQKQSS